MDICINLRNSWSIKTKFCYFFICTKTTELYNIEDIGKLGSRCSLRTPLINSVKTFDRMPNLLSHSIF